jgi:uncharacterized damage-inducible protein DinB
VRTMTSTPAVLQLLYLLDEAFDGTTEWHSLLGNLRSVTPEDWLWVPPGGERSIRDIVGHVGGCKLMYYDYAFGAGTHTWDDPLVKGDEPLATIDSAVAWLREVQERLRSTIARLDDDELLRPRKTNWGETAETRWIIAVMIQHDLYHAGEINHLRSLRQRSDRWEYDAG